MSIADTHPDGRPKSVVVLGAGDLVGHRVTRALIASGHDVTIAVSGDNVHEWSGTSRRVIPLEDPDAMRRAVVSHDAVVNLEPVTGEPRLHPVYPSLPASGRDLLRRSHRLGVTAFRSATGWTPGSGYPRSPLSLLPGPSPYWR